MLADVESGVVVDLFLSYRDEAPVGAIDEVRVNRVSPVRSLGDPGRDA
jgi:hypothetical protein